MFVTKLEVVNACLATMGETPLNTLEDDHAYKAAALNKLDDANKIEQKTGWWFNSEEIQLYPDDINKYIMIPQDAFAIQPIARVSPAFGQRGKRIYNTQNNTYMWTKPLWVYLIRLIEFEDLPYHCADAVQYGAIMRFQREFDGDTTRYNQLAQDYSRARMELKAEDVRNRKPNLLLTNSNLGSLTAIGFPASRFNRPGIPIWSGTN
jgi:tail tube protein